MNTTSDCEYLELAEEVAGHSNCVSRHVGCVIVKEGKVLATGWNGVHISPEVDCVQAGCPRCSAGETVTGVGYDRCICIHAEQVAIAAAAMEGVAVKDAVLYSTLRPCLNCAGNALAAGIRGIVYDRDWRYADDELEEAHRRLRERFSGFKCGIDASK